MKKALLTKNNYSLTETKFEEYKKFYKSFLEEEVRIDMEDVQADFKFLPYLQKSIDIYSKLLKNKPEDRNEIETYLAKTLLQNKNLKLYLKVFQTKVNSKDASYNEALENLEAFSQDYKFGTLGDFEKFLEYLITKQ